MSKTTKIVLMILKILAIIALIFSIASIIFFAAFKISISKASSNNSIPTIFGKEWITVSSDKFKEIVPKGCLVILEPIDPQNLTGTEILVYETKNTTVDNSVFGGYSLGRSVTNPSNSENATGTVLVQNIITGEQSIEVPLENVKSQALYQISFLGTLVINATSGLGFLQFVVIPICVFVVLVLSTFIAKILLRANDESSDERAYKNSYSQDTGEFSIRGIQKNNIYEDEDDEKDSYSSYDALQDNNYSDRLVRLRDKYIDSVDSTDEKFDLKFDKKTTALESEEENTGVADSKEIVLEDKFESNDVNDDLSSSLEEMQPATDEIDISKFESNNENIEQAEEISDNLENDLLKDILSETVSSDEKQERNMYDSEYDDATAQVDEFLRSLNIDVDTLQQEYMSHTTIEFDMDKLDSSSVIPEEKSKGQELLDNILIDLKDDALDFRFDALKSDSVEIKQSRKGDGFTIKTPKYKANIKVEIDKNE